MQRVDVCKKGMSGYMCLRKLNQARHSSPAVPHVEEEKKQKREQTVLKYCRHLWQI